jgi:hypothetical protein
LGGPIRDAFQRRRCLVPVDSFYEWKKTGTGKQPYAIALANESLMALAGLWENWRSPAGEWSRRRGPCRCSTRHSASRQRRGTLTRPEQELARTSLPG